jgi:hypothetical protein
VEVVVVVVGGGRGSNDGESLLEELNVADEATAAVEVLCRRW